MPSLRPSSKASIGQSLVFDDLDWDGVKDDGEQPLVGVNVTLYRSDGQVVGSVLTDANGAYEFTGLEPGNYYISVALEVGGNGNYVFSPIDESGSGRNQIFANNGTSSVETIGYNGNYDQWNVGMYLPLSTIGGPASVVFNDLDGGGIKDDGKGPLVGVNITLFHNGVAVGSVLTDANGTYEFAGLGPNE